MRHNFKGFIHEPVTTASQNLQIIMFQRWKTVRIISTKSCKWNFYFLRVFSTYLAHVKFCNSYWTWCRVIDQFPASRNHSRNQNGSVATASCGKTVCVCWIEKQREASCEVDHDLFTGVSAALETWLCFVPIRICVPLPCTRLAQSFRFARFCQINFGKCTREERSLPLIPYHWKYIADRLYCSITIFCMQILIVDVLQTKAQVTSFLTILKRRYILQTCLIHVIVLYTCLFEQTC